MKYNVQWLINEINNNQSIKYLFFWGHQPSKTGETIKSCFSQWWISPFDIDGITYRSAEHWMMAAKARLFNDADILKKILSAKSPAEAKKLGRMVNGFDNEQWQKESYSIVLKGNLHKFAQHPELKEFILNTGDRVLVEASPVDPVWGIGLAEDNEDSQHPEKWKGTNLLGFALMEVRDELRK
jgi:ribA/ribD-fused uncharacterized protein